MVLATFSPNLMTFVTLKRTESAHYYPDRVTVLFFDGWLLLGGLYQIR